MQERDQGSGRGAIPRRSDGARSAGARGAAAEVSSLASTLEELTRRVTSLAERADAAGDADTANELFTVERALSTALRRLDRLGRA